MKSEGTRRREKRFPHPVKTLHHRVNCVLSISQRCVKRVTRSRYWTSRRTVQDEKARLSPFTDETELFRRSLELWAGDFVILNSLLAASAHAPRGTMAQTDSKLAT